MNNTELVLALRWCPSHGCGRCVALDANGRCTLYGVVGLMSQAADLIEAQQKRIAELSLDNKMLRNTIDADKCVMLDRIRFLEAQLPKQGEWIDDNGANVPLDRDGYTTGMCRCSVCNDWLIASDEYEVRGRYCQSCGSRMAKGEQE